MTKDEAIATFDFDEIPKCVMFDPKDNCRFIVGFLGKSVKIVFNIFALCSFLNLFEKVKKLQIFHLKTHELCQTFILIGKLLF